MQISVLVPTYNRPEQLGEALASIARQAPELIGEVLVGDDSAARYRDANRAVVASNPLARLIEYIPNAPAKGTYPNQCFLASRARCKHILFLHHDDLLCDGALETLAKACEQETDTRVEVWFGRNLIMDESGRTDMVRTLENDAKYGKTGVDATAPLWQWALTESLPPNAFLIRRDSYLRHMQGPRDGNVGDFALVVRLANDGCWGHYIAQYFSAYRVQPTTVTSAGRGMDVHLWYELAQQLQVPPEAQAQKVARFSEQAAVAAVRYARDGERLKGWKCWLSPHTSWRYRLSPRGLVTAVMLMTPRPMWRWALRYAD